MVVGLEMAPLIKEFIAKLIFKLEDDIALLLCSFSTSTSTLADRKSILSTRIFAIETDWIKNENGVIVKIHKS